MSNNTRSDLLGRRDVGAYVGGQGEVPHPWEKHLDDEYQAYYYFNPLTQETRWADANGQLPYVPEEEEQSNPNPNPNLNPNLNQYNCEYDQDDPYELDDEYNLDELDGDASISNMSRLSQLSVIERSEFHMANKRDKQEALRMQLLQREEEELRNPEINKRSKQLNRNVEDMFAWEEQRKARMEALAAQQRAAENAQMTGKPTLYASSNASVSSYNSNDGLPVEARLLAYEEKRKLKLQQTIAQEKNDARRSAIPTIAPHSAQLVQRRAAAIARGEEAPQSSNRRVAAADMTGILKDNTTGQTFFQPKLNRKSEQIAAQSRPNMPIEDLLAGKGKLLQQKQAERERRLEQKAQELRQVSKVNPHSNQLVQNRYILQGETTQDRLAKPIGTVKQKTLEEIEKPTFKPTLNPVSLEMTANNGYNNGYGNGYGMNSQGGNNRGNEESAPYSPQEEALQRFNSMYNNDDYSFDGEGGEPLLYEDLLRGSYNGSGGGGGGRNTSEPYMYNSSSHSLQGSSQQQQHDAMYHKTQRWNEMRQQKLEKERKQRERKEREDCTFKPKIDASSVARAGRSSHNNSFSYNNNSNNNNNSYYQDNDGESEAGGNIDAYVERQLTWVEKKEQKLEQERRKALERELADCSFVPKVRANPNIQVTSSVSGIINGQATTTVGQSNKPTLAPTNTTFGSNLASTTGNTQSYRSSSESAANVRRGGAATAKVAYNANKARQSQWADEGPFYVSDEASAVSNTTNSKNKYYTASNPYANDHYPGHNDNTYTDNSYQEEYNSEEEYDVVPPAPPAAPAAPAAPALSAEPTRIKVPLPVKSTTNTNNNSAHTSMPAMRFPQHAPTTSQKSVHFDSLGEGPLHSTQCRNNNAMYSDYTNADNEDTGYTDNGPHEVTVDYGHSPYSDRSDDYPHTHNQDVHDEEESYNGLPFQVSAHPSHSGRSGSNEGSPYSPGSPAAGQGYGHTQGHGPPPHRLFPATPYQPHQHPQSSQSSQQHAGHTANPRTNAQFASFVEPADDEDYDTLPSPRGSSHAVPPQHQPPQMRYNPHGNGTIINGSNHNSTNNMPVSRRMYQDEAERDSPPPPPPVVFRDSRNNNIRPAMRPTGPPPGTSVEGHRGAVGYPNRASASAAAGTSGYTTSTPYGGARRGVESQLLSPDEDLL